MGKVHRLPSIASTNVYAKRLELIFCDLWGPSHVTYSHGYYYFLTSVDAYSWYTWVYPLKLKSHTLTTFVQFKALVELQLNPKIKVVQTKGGGEFKLLTHFLTTHGIVHRTTCSHTHHHNGYVERKHKDVVETGLTLIDRAKLPIKFWDYAFITTRLPTPSDE